MFFAYSVLCNLRIFKFKIKRRTLNYKQKTSLKRCKAEIKIPANPWLA